MQIKDSRKHDKVGNPEDTRNDETGLVNKVKRVTTFQFRNTDLSNKMIGVLPIYRIY